MEPNLEVSQAEGQQLLCFFTIMALLVFIGAVVWYIATKLRSTREKDKEIFKPLHKLTALAFLVIALLHIPIFIIDRIAVYGNGADFLRPVLLAVINALRVFLLDINFEHVAEVVNKISGDGFQFERYFYLIFVALMYLIAPILTATNLLSLFHNLTGEITLKFTHFKRIYIFSELNPKSVAMAKSIVRLYGRKARIVFTDVLRDNNETSFDAANAKELNRAIYLKKDITAFVFKGKQCHIEYFIIGGNESENIEQFIRLNEECRQYRDRSVFLFSSSPNAQYVIDSIDKGKNTLSKKLYDRIDADPDAFVKGEMRVPANGDFTDNYYIRRIDHVRQLATDALTSEQLLNVLLSPEALERRLISLTIIGLGSYGRAFLKSALWIFQIYGFELEINLVDVKSGEALLRMLRKEMPEIFADQYRIEGEAGALTFACRKDYENRYLIRLFGGVDCTTFDGDELFARPLFRQTQLALVTLGNDNKNIEAAVNLRSQFDRLKGVNKEVLGEEIFAEEYDKEKKDDVILINRCDELPLIYAVVYEDRKALGLDCGSGAPDEPPGIVNHGHIPYHVHIIGSMSEQFSYQTILRQRQREQSALKFHTEWVQTAGTMRDYYCMKHPSPKEENALALYKTTMNAYFKGKEPHWDDDRLWGKSAEQRRHEIFKLAYQYENYEYYRDSSISKAIHKDIIENVHLKEKNDGMDYFLRFDTEHLHAEGLPVCCCPCCQAKRISEHMRWNAYMRVNGYTYADTRADRAKQHHNLIPWNALSISEQMKD